MFAVFKINPYSNRTIFSILLFNVSVNSLAMLYCSYFDYLKINYVSN